MFYKKKKKWCPVDPTYNTTHALPPRSKDGGKVFVPNVTKHCDKYTPIWHPSPQFCSSSEEWHYYCHIPLQKIPHANCEPG